MALAKKTSVLREAMLSFVEPRHFGVNNNKTVPRRVCRRLLKPCQKSRFRSIIIIVVTYYITKTLVYVWRSNDIKSAEVRNVGIVLVRVRLHV